MSRFLIYALWFGFLMASLAALRVWRKESVHSSDVLLCGAAAVASAVIHLTAAAGVIDPFMHEMVVYLVVLYTMCIPVTARTAYIVWRSFIEER